MQARTKIILIGCSLLAALFHFTAVCYFAFIVNTEKKVPPLLRRYCDPLFYQNWKLFVPPPASNYYLLVNIPNEGTVDVFAEVKAQHQRNRFAGKGHQLIAFVNYLHYFEKNTAPGANNLSNNLYFQLLKNACLHYVNASRHLQLKELPLTVFIRPIGNYPPRSYFSS